MKERRLGQQLNLLVTLPIDDSTKVMKAKILSLKDKSVIESDIPLAYLSDATYLNNSKIMPNSDIYVITEVFEQDGVTLSYDTPQVYAEEISLVRSWQESGCSVEGSIIDDKVDGSITDDKLTATVKEC